MAQTEPWERYEVDFTDEEKKIAREMNESGRQIRARFRAPRGMDHYLLDEHNVCIAVPLGTWAVWFERENKKENRGRIRVGLDEWDDVCFGHVRVSTVFLGLDHGFGFGDVTVTRRLFETMIFWGWSDDTQWSEQAQWRYPTYDTAVKGHAHALRHVKRFLAGEITREQFENDEGGD